MISKKTSLILLAVAFSVQVACAGLLVSDPAAMNGWTGTMSFASDGFTAEADYAVFAPGNFDGIDQSAGYVYAYQLFNTSTNGSGLSLFTVGLVPGSSAIEAGSVDTYNGGVQASQIRLSHTLGAYQVTFDTSVLPVGQHSEVFLITSPFGPTTVSSSVMNSGRSDNVHGQAPSPVPEPSTLALMGIAGLFLRKRRC